MNPYAGLPIWAVLLSLPITAFGLWVFFGYYFYLREKYHGISPPRLWASRKQDGRSDA